MSLRARLRAALATPVPPEEDQAAWFRLFSTDASARARAITAVAPPVESSPPDAPSMLRSSRH